MFAVDNQQFNRTAQNFFAQGTKTQFNQTGGFANMRKQQPKVQRYQGAYVRQDEGAALSPQEMAAFYANASNAKKIINSRRK